MSFDIISLLNFIIYVSMPKGILFRFMSNVRIGIFFSSDPITKNIDMYVPKMSLF